MNYNFIIISDDQIYIELTKMLISKIYHDSQTISFNTHAEALEYIPQNNDPTVATCVFLDRWLQNVYDCFDFLEEFEKIPEENRNSFYLYVVTTTVHKQDMNRAQSNKLVEHYLIKPLTKESIRLIVHSLNKRLGIS